MFCLTCYFEFQASCRVERGSWDTTGGSSFHASGNWSSCRWRNNEKPSRTTTTDKSSVWDKTFVLLYFSCALAD